MVFDPEKMDEEQKDTLAFARHRDRMIRQDARCEKGEHVGEPGKKCSHCGAEIPTPTPTTTPKKKNSKWE